MLLGAALALSACSAEDMFGEYKDAGVSGIDETEAELILMPDGFGNLAAKCHGPNMIYSSKVPGDGRSLAVVPNDPRCE